MSTKQFNPQKKIKLYFLDKKNVEQFPGMFLNDCALELFKEQSFGSFVIFKFKLVYKYRHLIMINE